jgi:hypothetical protein
VHGHRHCCCHFHSWVVGVGGFLLHLVILLLCPGICGRRRQMWCCFVLSLWGMKCGECECILACRCKKAGTGPRVILH